MFNNLDLGRVEVVLLHVLDEVLPVGVVLCSGGPSAVGDEGDSVGTLEHDAPRSVMNHLAGHGEELHLDLEAIGSAEEDGQQIEEQGAVVVGLDGQQPASHFGAGPLMHHLQIRRLPRKTGAVIDNLDGQFPLGVIQLHVEGLWGQSA